MGELQIIAIIVIIVGWAITFGKLHQQVKEIHKTLNNGLVQKMEEYGIEVAKLDGASERIDKACEGLAELRGSVNTFLEYQKGVKSG